MTKTKQPCFSTQCFSQYRHQVRVRDIPLVSRGLAKKIKIIYKASACRLQVSLSCAVLCQIVSLQYLSRSPLHRYKRGPSVVFEEVGMPCPGPFRFSHFADHVYDCCPLPDPDVGLSSLYMMLSIRLSILVCAAASFFCACLSSAPYIVPGSTHGCLILFKQMAKLLLKISRSHYL